MNHQNSNGQLNGVPPGQIQVRPEQAAALFALKRSITMLAMEADCVRQMGAKSVADYLGEVADRMDKYMLELVGESQRRVVVPKLVMP